MDLGMTSLTDLLHQAHESWKSQQFRAAVEALLEALPHCDAQQRKDVEQNLSLCYWNLGQFEHVVEILQARARSQGQLARDQHRLLSNCLRYQGRYQESEQNTRELSDSQWRDLDLGWYEHLRDNTRVAFQLTESGRPALGWTPIAVPAHTQRWRGQPVKQLVLLEEAGDGDMMLFARWIPMLADRCDEILYAGRSTLSAVFQRLWDVRPLQAWSKLERDHAALAMMSLADQLEITDIGTDAYFSANPDWIYYYRRLAPKTRARIGICWSGESQHKENHLRSVTPDLMISNLGDLAEILNLQMATTAPPGVITVDFREWEQTLALISDCDVVVTVDTSVAHASAAMGVPTVVLTNRACYYTWKPYPPVRRTRWYPRAWNVTQITPGDWTAPMQHARQQVIEILSQK